MNALFEVYLQPDSYSATYLDRYKDSYLDSYPDGFLSE